MKNLSSFIKNKIIGGVFFMVPIILLVIIIGKALEIFRRLVAPIADRIDISLLGNHTIARILAAIVLILLCLLAGLLAKTKIAGHLKDWIEENILSAIPGYSLLKGMTETAAGLDSEHLKEVVLVDVEEVWQLGFLMERVDDNLNAVFIPGSPNPMAGDVVFVKWDRLRLIDIEEISAMKINRKLGVHSKKILSGIMNKDMFQNDKS